MKHHSVTKLTVYTLVNKITGKLTWRQSSTQGLHIFYLLIGAMIVFASFCSPSFCGSTDLNLGCVPMRALRSQRLTNPRRYLTSRTHEPPSAPTITTYEHRPQLLPVHSGNQLNLARATSINSDISFRNLTAMSTQMLTSLPLR